MNRKIVDFHKDEEAHWVADLECGHAQHVRHDPPMVERPWVLTPEGRDSRLGAVLNCKICDEQPAVMVNAREDLAGNVSGKFSPGDWAKIQAIAREKMAASTKPEHEAWIGVIRDFHREKYWGFVPNYVRPKTPRHEQNLGKRFIWYSFRSFLLTKVAVLYFGARYTIDLDPIYGWLFFGAIAFMLGNYGLFLYRYGGRPEK